MEEVIFTALTFKFAIGQEVWFIEKNKAQKGYVRARQITESVKRLEDEVAQFKRATSDTSITIYSLTNYLEIDPNWQFEEDRLFRSKQELLESL